MITKHYFLLIVVFFIHLMGMRTQRIIRTNNKVSDPSVTINLDDVKNLFENQGKTDSFFSKSPRSSLNLGKEMDVETRESKERLFLVNKQSTESHTKNAPLFYRGPQYKSPAKQ